jgi:hypothetical protein
VLREGSTAPYQWDIRQCWAVLSTGVGRSSRQGEKIGKGKVIKSNVQSGFIFVTINLRIIEELWRREGVSYLK